MKKRLLSTILALCMVLGLLPSTVYADNSSVSFTDVNATDWFSDAVQYVSQNGLMSGTDNAIFSPDDPITRGQIVTILHRLEGTPSSAGMTFADVPNGKYYANAVAWSSANNIMGGYGDGLFAPEDPITREQLATTIYRYTQYKRYDATITGNVAAFSDGETVSSYAVDAVNWAIGAGLLNGMGDNMFAPTKSSTRAQAATILMRFCENIVAPDDTTPGKDTTAAVEYHTVTFDYNYDNKGTCATATVEHGKTVTSPKNPTRSGYNFSGWCMDASGNNRFNFNTAVTSDLILYARWTVISSGFDGGNFSNDYVPSPAPPSGGGGNGGNDDPEFTFVDPDGYGDYDYAMTSSVDPEPEYESVDDYFAETANEVIDKVEASEADTMLTEAEVKALLADRDFTEYPITYKYSVSGEYVGETEVLDNSDAKHPIYETYYVSGDEESGNQVLWVIAVINRSVFANPASFFFETGYNKEFLVTETEQFISYYDGYFYVTTPNPSVVFTHKIKVINAAALDNLTIDALCDLAEITQSQSAGNADNERSVVSLLDALDITTPVSASERAAVDGTPIIVSFGDSYSSGEGIEPFIDQELSWPTKVQSDDFLAHRSTKSWPKQIRVDGQTPELYFVAASGAVTADIDQKRQSKPYDRHGQKDPNKTLSKQIDVFNTVNGNTVDYVTLTIGGNDVDFAEVITICATESSYLNAWLGKTSDLKQKLNELWNNIDTTMANIRRVYEAIAREAPQATIIVAGYPQLLEKTGKGLTISKEEATLVNNKVHDFNGKIAELVKDCQSSIKIVFVDVETIFEGHEAYARDEWINPIIPLAQAQDLSGPFVSAYSMHPNATGAEAYASRVNSKISLLEKSNKMLSGVITIADTDTDMTNNIPLAGAKITLTKMNILSPGVYSATSDRAGVYRFENLTSGRYVIVVAADGYIPVTGIVTINDNMDNTYNAAIEAISFGIFGGEGTAAGTVYDVLTGSGVPGLTLNIRKGINKLDGEIAATVTTGSNGSYTTPALEAGNYTVQVLDERVDDSGIHYLDGVFIIKILGNQLTPNQNGNVTSSLQANQLRIVLRWGLNPNDLDSHLVGPTASGGQFHTYFSSQDYYDESGTLTANLDLDDTDSYGPETTTVYEMTDGVYTFMVHDYTNRDRSTSTALGNSGAYVEVYLGTEPIPYTIYVPTGDGTLWTVFSYDSNTGIFTWINTLSYHDDPSTVGSSDLMTPREWAGSNGFPLKDYELYELQAPKGEESDD